LSPGLCFDIGILASKIERLKFPYRMYEMQSFDLSQSGIKPGQEGAALNTALDHTSASIATPKTTFCAIKSATTSIPGGRSSFIPKAVA
jgi:hypothetical protein